MTSFIPSFLRLAFNLAAAQGDGFVSCLGPGPLYHAGTRGLSLSHARLPAKPPGKVLIPVGLLLVMSVVSVKEEVPCATGTFICYSGKGGHDKTTLLGPSVSNAVVIFSLTAKVERNGQAGKWKRQCFVACVSYCPPQTANVPLPASVGRPSAVWEHWCATLDLSAGCLEGEKMLMLLFLRWRQDCFHPGAPTPVPCQSQHLQDPAVAPGVTCTTTKPTKGMALAQLSSRWWTIAATTSLKSQPMLEFPVQQGTS